MTEVTYEDGIMRIQKDGHDVKFRLCDLDFESRKEFVHAVNDLAPCTVAGFIGFLKTQPVEARQRALEEAMGVSFPCGIGE